MWSLAPALGVTMALAAPATPVPAALSGVAERGDNCTPFNGFRIGYATARGATIIDQRIVLAYGWDLVGWLILDASHETFFVPYAPYFELNAARDQSAAVPALFPAGKGGADLAGAYATYLRWRQQNGLQSIAPTALPDKLLIGPCFAHPLSVR